MAEKPDQDTQETSQDAEPDPEERFSLYPLATDEALRSLLQSEADREADEDDSHLALGDVR